MRPLLMKVPSLISLVALYLFAFSSPCFALLSFGYISKEKAEAEGMEIRWKPAGPKGVWVELSFKTDGTWKAFDKPQSYNYVDLRVKGGEESAYIIRAALREDRRTKGRIIVSFTAERARLEQIELWVIQYVAGVAGVLQMKDFIALDQIDPPRKEESGTSAGADVKIRQEDGGASPPAAAATPAPDED